MMCRFHGRKWPESLAKRPRTESTAIQCTEKLLEPLGLGPSACFHYKSMTKIVPFCCNLDNTKSRTELCKRLPCRLVCPYPSESEAHCLSLFFCHLPDQHFHLHLQQILLACHPLKEGFRGPDCFLEQSSVRVDKSMTGGYWMEYQGSADVSILLWCRQAPRCPPSHPRTLCTGTRFLVECCVRIEQHKQSTDQLN